MPPKGYKYSEEEKAQYYAHLKLRPLMLGRHHSDETKAKMSASGKAKIFTEEHKRNISLSKIGKPNGQTGKKRSQESRIQQSLRMGGDGTLLGTMLGKRNRKLKREYNMTLEEYDNLFNSQNGMCAICNRTNNNKNPSYKNLNIDHNHQTGKVRGLLCHNCNIILGLTKDNPNILRKAADYLERK